MNIETDFDVNILADCLSEPTIALTFPLPTDQETYVSLDGNEKLWSNTFSLVANFFNFFSLVNFDEIYAHNEYKHSINKYSPTFNKKLTRYMDDKLEKSDERLDELVYSLVNKELNLKLINAADFSKRFNEVKAFMVAYYKLENAKNFPTFKSHNFLRVCYITVMSTFKKMFPQGIWCKKSDFDKLYLRYLLNPMSIVFLPNHQSHIDYIIVHLLTIRFQLSTPAVIAGENLNVAVFGKILKNLGAIFIPRSFNNELYTEHNLNNLIEFLLQNYVHFEVFIEGTRSRDGKLLLPKYGILKTLTNIYLKQRYVDKNENFDCFLLPMNITYERIYETDGYLKELIGDDKKQESFFNILNNGLSNLVKGSDNGTVFDKAGYNDNTGKKLSGKIFIKLGDGFTLSEFMANDNDVDIDPYQKEFVEPTMNLKKLGFKILHEINRISYLPEVSIIGTSLQIYHYFHESDIVKIHDVVPTLRLVIDILYRENKDESIANSTILQNLGELSDSELIAVIKEQVVTFFRFIKVNKHDNTLKIENSIELLYYKNLSIHSVIQRCMVSFVLLILNGKNSNYRNINKLFYIITGFLKNEFLFDYNYKERHGLSFILHDMVEQEIVTKTVRTGSSDEYHIVDHKYLKLWGNLVKPFLESYVNLISNIFDMISTKQEDYYRMHLKHKHDANFDVDELKYPTTKMLLKQIVKKNRGKACIESNNKQYLLSDLYYLDNLLLIRIFKNKSKTQAFVRVKNQRDLNIVLKFLNQLIGQGDDSMIQNETSINYIIDIIDKRDDRDYDNATLKSKF